MHKYYVTEDISSCTRKRHAENANGKRKYLPGQGGGGAVSTIIGSEEHRGTKKSHRGTTMSPLVGVAAVAGPLEETSSPKRRRIEDITKTYGYTNDGEDEALIDAQSQERYL